jgi:hypothetical protein
VSDQEAVRSGQDADHRFPGGNGRFCDTSPLIMASTKDRFPPTAAVIEPVADRPPSTPQRSFAFAPINAGPCPVAVIE